MKERGLTLKQKEFLREYKKTGFLDSASAAKKVGYSEIYVRQLLTKPNVKKYLQEEKKKILTSANARSGITVGELLDEAVKTLRMYLAPITVRDPETGDPVLDNDGHPVVRPADGKEASRMFDIVSKMVGAYDADNHRKVDGTLEIVWGEKKDD